MLAQTGRRQTRKASRRGVLAAGGLPADGLIERELRRRFAGFGVVAGGLVPVDGVPLRRGTRRGYRRRSGWLTDVETLQSFGTESVGNGGIGANTRLAPLGWCLPVN